MNYVVCVACRHYFALATNPGEQFFAFSNLAVWLLNLMGQKTRLDQPQEVPQTTQLDLSFQFAFFNKLSIDPSDMSLASERSERDAI